MSRNERLLLLKRLEDIESRITTLESATAAKFVALNESFKKNDLLRRVSMLEKK